MAIKGNSNEEVERLMDWKDFKYVLATANNKDRLYAYLKLLDFLSGRKQAQPADAGKAEKDDAEKMIDQLFNS